MFVQYCAKFRMRVYQLNFVSAYLQAPATGRTFTTILAAWAQHFPNLAEWFGTPLFLLWSLYSGRTLGKSWDNTLAGWLVDN